MTFRMNGRSSSVSQSAPRTPRVEEQKAAHPVDDARPKVDLLRENERLREVALDQERSLLIEKMKLRLCHDHRDLLALRGCFARLRDSGELRAENDEIPNKKAQIGNLCDRIAKEKERVRRLQQGVTVETRAAVVIQSAARGFLLRRSVKEQTQ
jgi:hypothetical protein